MEWSENARVSRNPEMVSSVIDGEAVMMSVEKGEYYGLNPVATDIWNMLEEPLSIYELIDMLTDKYDVCPSQCKHDVLIFLEALVQKNLVLIHP